MNLPRRPPGSPRNNRPDAKAREKISLVLASLPKLLAFIWRTHPWLLLGIIGVFVTNAFVPATILAMQRHVVNGVAAHLQGKGNLPATLTWLLAVVGMSALGALLGQASGLLNGHLQEDLTFRVRAETAAKVQRLSLAYFDLPTFYDDLQRAQQDAPQRLFFMFTNALGLVQSFLTLSTYLYLLAAAHWSLVALVVLVTMPAAWSGMHFARLRHRLLRQQTPLQRESNYISGLLTSRDVAKEVRLFGLVPYLTARWRTLFERMRRENLALQRKSALGGFAANVAAAGGLAGASAILAAQVFRGALTLGDFVALTQAVTQSQGSLNTLSSSFNAMYEHALIATEVFTFLALPEEAASGGNLPCPRPIRQAIRFEGVSFRYPEAAADVLQDLTFEIRPGEQVALVGENGAGKTTLVKLLLGLYRPSAGRITYDGIDLRELDPTSVRREVTVVFQDFARFDLTAQENIGFGDLDRLHSETALAAAARQGGADEFLQRLPNGYQTTLGRYFKDGHELSYGQWQKVAISRAFFRDAQVVVLDEPTAALDARAEAEVFRQFGAVAAGKTSIFISHRLGTARAADRILVLKQGRLVEQGHHDALVAHGGEYARMYELQAQWYQ